MDVSDRSEAVIWPIKASLQPTDTACGTCPICLPLNPLVTRKRGRVTCYTQISTDRVPLTERSEASSFSPASCYSTCGHTATSRTENPASSSCAALIFGICSPFSLSVFSLVDPFSLFSSPFPLQILSLSPCPSPPSPVSASGLRFC